MFRLLAVGLKQVIYVSYVAVAVIAIGVVITCYFKGIIKDAKALIALISCVLSAIYFIQKQKLEEEKFLFESFATYNLRFAELSDALQQLPTKQSFEPKHKATVARYFDLCAEEYFLFKRGRLSKEIWSCWAKGALFYVNEYSSVESYWRDMEKLGINYGLTIKMLEKFSQ